MQTCFRKLALGLALVATVSLTGCMNHPDWVKAGSSGEQVIAQIGQPDARMDHKDGSYTLVYSGQPFGLETYWMHFDKNGLYQGKEKTMNEAHFKLVKVGVHTKADIFQMFGKCAQEYDFKLQNETAYMYRFEEAGGMRMAFWVQFDTNDVVTEWAITQDPWDHSDDWLLF